MSAADDGVQQDLEERKVRLEEGKLALEQSFAKKWGSFVIGASVTAGVAILTIGMNTYQSSIARDDRLSAEKLAQAQADETHQQQKGQWGINVLQLYITHPEGFDPVKSPETARNNMTALALSAPDVMRPILLSRLDSLVRSDGAANPGALGAVKTALDQVPLANQSTNSNSTVVATTGAGAPGPTAPEAGPTSPLPPGVDPAAYSVYIQFGSASKGFATAYGAQLRAAGFRVPDLEQVEQSPNEPQVRYYQTEQTGLADWLAARLDAQTPGGKTHLRSTSAKARTCPAASSRCGYRPTRDENRHLTH